MIRKLLLLAALAATTAHAQTWYMVAPEGASTVVTIPAGTTYRVGVVSCPATNAAAWSASVTVAAATTFNPFDLGTNAAAFPFADPCPNVVKDLQVLETSAAQALTLNGAAVSVPALAATAPGTSSTTTIPPITQTCPLPTTGNANPAIPATPALCSLAAGAVAVATDGETVLVTAVAAPVYLQYCQGSVCNAPFLLIAQPGVVGPTAQLGGPPGGTGIGTLYAIPGAAAVSFAVAPAPATTVTVPAAAP